MRYGRDLVISSRKKVNTRNYVNPKKVEEVCSAPKEKPISKAEKCLHCVKRPAKGNSFFCCRTCKQNFDWSKEALKYKPLAKKFDPDCVFLSEMVKEFREFQSLSREVFSLLLNIPCYSLVRLEHEGYCSSALRKSLIDFGFDVTKYELDDSLP